MARAGHICHLTTVHPWSDTRIFERMCAGLAERGYRVTLVAPVDARFRERGVEVVPSGLRGKVTRVIGGGGLLRRLVGINAEIYHFHDPELLPWMALFRRRAGVRVVYDVHEYYPESVVDSNYFQWRPLSRMAGIAFGVAEPRLARTLDAVIGVTPPITDRFTGGRAHTLTVANYPVLADDEPLPSPVDLPSPRTLVVGGVIDRNRLGDEMIDALALLAPRWKDLHLLSIGDLLTDPYGRELRARARARGVDDRVTFRSRLPWRELQAYVAGSAVGLVLLADRQTYRWSLPNRLFEFMAQGVPVVATGFPLVAEVVRSSGCGVVLERSGPDAIAAAIERLLCDPEAARAMGARGTAAVRDRYHWSAELDKLSRLYDEL
jgi:glycosyltransferase involved in cell wall biosynthesis